MASTSPRSNSSSNRDKTSLVRHLSGQILPDIKDGLSFMKYFHSHSFFFTCVIELFIELTL